MDDGYREALARIDDAIDENATELDLVQNRGRKLQRAV